MIKGGVHTERICIFLILFVLSGQSPATGIEILYESQYGDCVVRGSYNSYRIADGVISVKVDKNNTGDCEVSSVQLVKAISESIRVYKSRNNKLVLKNIFIGRIYKYPHLSKFLQTSAENDRRWNRENGKPDKGHVNYYVNKILYSKQLMKTVISELNILGISLTGISCEKVLINKNKLPYDAMCWLKVN